MLGQAIPILPARSLDETLAFYGRLGFAVAFRQTAPDAYAILRRDGIELHFWGFATLDPARNYAGAYLRVADARALFEEFRAKRIERLGEPEDKPWGMREFALIDPNGNLLRIGEAIGKGN